MLNDQRGFITLCIPIGLGIAAILVAWPFWLVQIIGYEMEWLDSKIALFIVGPIIDVVIMVLVGLYIDRRTKNRKQKYKYVFVLPMIMVAVLTGLVRLGFTGLGC